MYATEILTFFCAPYSFAYLVVFILAFFYFERKAQEFKHVCTNECRKHKYALHSLEKAWSSNLSFGKRTYSHRRETTWIETYCIVTSQFEGSIRLVPEMVREALVLLAKRHPLLKMKVVVKKSQNREAAEEYFTEVEDPRKINFKVAKDFTADDL